MIRTLVQFQPEQHKLNSIIKTSVCLSRLAMMFLTAKGQAFLVYHYELWWMKQSKQISCGTLINGGLKETAESSLASLMVK